MHARTFCLGIVAALAAAVAQAQAGISITNSSFESPILADGVDNFNSGDTIPGWVIDRGDTAVYNPAAANFANEASLNGSNVVWLNSGIIHQDLGTMVAGETYSFDISYAWRSEPGVPDASQFAFLLRPNITSSNAFVFAHSAAFSEGAPSGGNVFTVADPVRGSLTHAILQYTATGADNGQPLAVQLQATDLQLLIDQVKLTTTVPEPASLGALGIAAAGLLTRRRRA